jgi:integrase
MFNDANNNPAFTASSEAVLTLGDLYAFVGRSNLPASAKGPIRSAIKRADQLVGHGALDTQANAAVLMKRLEVWSPAMAGMSRAAYANMKSRLRAAFRLAEPRLAKSRSRPALKGAWRTLQDTLEVGPQRKLSRLFHYAAAQGWSPSDITDHCLVRFASHVRDEAMVGDWDKLLQATIRTWNHLPQVEKEGSLQRLAPPPPKRTPYWIPSDQWPDGLRTDVEALIQCLSKPNLYAGTKVRKIKPATVAQYGHMMSTLVSAAVGSGIALNRLQRLSDALAPDMVGAALTFLSERGGDKVTPIMIQMMIRVLVVAEITGRPALVREELKAMLGNVQTNAPAECQRRHMASKNRALLERLENDQQFADLIHTLPDRLAKGARAQGADSRSGPALFRTALAIDLLLTCSMRRENLVSLQLGKSVKRMGNSPNHFWIIQIDAEEVKNYQPLRFKLQGVAAALLEEYVTQWRSRLSAVPTDWLFPRVDGTMLDPKSLALAIQKHTKRVLGVAISPHQFRHISAETFLLEHPDKLALMSEHLGHRDANTTRTYYSRSKQKQASRIYQDHALEVRDDAGRRLAKLKPKQRRPSARPGR